MNNLYKIGIVLSIFMILAVGATGCVTTTTPTATPTESIVTATPVATKSVAKSTVKPTQAPAKAAVNSAVDSDVQDLINKMEAMGYTVVVPAKFVSTDAHGDRVFVVTFRQGSYDMLTTITKSSTANSDADFNAAISSATADGYTGKYTPMENYQQAWQGSMSGSAIIIGQHDNGWIIQIETS